MGKFLFLFSQFMKDHGKTVQQIPSKANMCISPPNLAAQGDSDEILPPDLAGQPFSYLMGQYSSRN